MKYSKATNYALHTVLFLAASTPSKPVGVQKLAELQKVSPTYLSKILTKLVKDGIIDSSSGANGGYSFNRNWKDVSLLDVIHAIEGKSSFFECYLTHDSKCLIREAIVSAEKKMEEELRNQKISEMAKKISVDF